MNKQRRNVLKSILGAILSPLLPAGAAAAASAPKSLAAESKLPEFARSSLPFDGWIFTPQLSCSVKPWIVKSMVWSEHSQKYLPTYIDVGKSCLDLVGYTVISPGASNTYLINGLSVGVLGMSSAEMVEMCRRHFVHVHLKMIQRQWYVFDDGESCSQEEAA